MIESEDRRPAVEALIQLVREMPVAMLTTMVADRSLTSRPMVNINSKFDGDLWFFTHEDDPKVSEILGNPQVNVSFAEPSNGRFVSIAGAAQLVRDPKRAEMLWTDECARWFPDGLNDPRLALLRVNVNRAEFWDAKLNAMRAVTGFLQGKKPPIDNEKIDWKS
jgi:general stress protein 26